MYNDYKDEIKMAKEFILDHNYDSSLLGMIRECKREIYTHSERWSILYDYCADHYPGATGTLITGLAYLCEEED